MPTSGGLYYWTHYFSSPKTRNALSFLVGYSNTLGLVGGLCSIDYGFSLMFLSVIVIARDGNWTPSNGVIYAVFLACVLCHGVLASVLSKVMGKLVSIPYGKAANTADINPIANGIRGHELHLDPRYHHCAPSRQRLRPQLKRLHLR